MLGVAQLINEAWTYESNNEHDVALRLYRTTFNNLLDINVQLNTASLALVPGVSPFEVRSVADYVNHRTCSIYFTLNHPREAITQFKKYIDIFKQHTKSPEYAFEHAAWLSQQYLMFADLFHQAVENGIKASKAQHPGHYYFEAAMQMVEKRRNITEYTNDTIRSNQMPVTNELLSMITTSNFPLFLRQCGWICVDPNVGPPVVPVKVSQPTENVISEPINYSDAIIKTLNKAIEYFRDWSRPRMQSFISAMMADEYVICNNHQSARALYIKTLAAYEKERWTPIVDKLKERLMLLDQSMGQNE